MTNKEAIKILKNYHNGYFGYKIDDVHEAHNLAIKALEEKTKGKWIKEEEMKDMYRCSECGRRVDGSVLDDLLMIDEDYMISDCYPYCHCGADMRGDSL